MIRIRTNFSWITKYQNTDNLKYLSEDIDLFLKGLPLNAGKTAVMVVLTAWSIAAVLVLLAVVKSDEMADKKLEILKAQALRPSVPKIQPIPIPVADLTKFVEMGKKSYPNLRIQPAGNGRLSISSGELKNYNEWRAAINHAQNMTNNIRVDIDTLCAGRECRGASLNATFKINRVTVR
jgi:hypothetical protein